jgi:hypothetical protein
MHESFASEPPHFDFIIAVERVPVAAFAVASNIAPPQPLGIDQLALIRLHVPLVHSLAMGMCPEVLRIIEN